MTEPLKTKNEIINDVLAGADQKQISKKLDKLIETTYEQGVKDAKVFIEFLNYSL